MGWEGVNRAPCTYICTAPHIYVVLIIQKGKEKTAGLQQVRMECKSSKRPAGAGEVMKCS